MRIVLSVMAGLLTALALFLLFAPTRTTLDKGRDSEVVVSCSASSTIGVDSRGLEAPNSRRYTFEILEGEENVKEVKERHSHMEWVGPYDVTDRIESHCDRLRTGRVAGIAFSLAPAAVLATVAIALPSIRRDFWTLPPERQ